LEVLLNNERTPKSRETLIQLSAAVDIHWIKSETQNIIAFLPGDPRFDETIVIGAHYDHLGMGGPGTSSRRPDTLAIHNGADDNASGITTALELFKELTKQRSQLKRNVLFIAFGAEELGTLGSKYFVDHPLVDLESIKFMFNFDMVGRLDSLNTLILYGTGTAVGLEALIREHNASREFQLTLSPEGLGPSDHASFYAQDIPVLMFFTGVHDDYHTPDDDADQINYTGQKRVTDYAYDLVWDIINRDSTMVFQEAGPRQRQSSRRRFKVTLGIMPDVAGVEKRGMRVDAVMPDRPAYYAGMKKGDIIIAIDGKPVKDVYEYMHRLSQCQAGQRISVKVLRDDKPVILIVEL